MMDGIVNFNQKVNMGKKTLILKTHGLRNSSEAGMVILPENFYVKVHIEMNGDFEVEFINSSEEQLFSVCHQINSKIEKEPTVEQLRKKENQVARHIVDTLARFLLDESGDTSPTFDTEHYLSMWSAAVAEVFL